MSSPGWRLMQGTLRCLRWLIGCETPPRKPAHDDLEPYCDQEALQGRMPATFTPGELKAIRKIGARYGAEL